MNEKMIILVTFASIVLAACTAGVETEGKTPPPKLTNSSSVSTGTTAGRPAAPGQPADARVCTMEAKLCPDGSYVSRNAANHCAFDPCPGEKR
ncbi:hypothetical protein VSS37_02000 [Candidatus Thiothrix sp. Deng01]|uniref:Kazal-like domain-containing protein n=1 Tax=Candidatus Thiothrix phosphatis TaxID=3112415 RepID=A0ABU6CUJ1_9GAMM|nr:hypothetical protein [Candidatus Thiothrix sp. Deng01]MEB4589743.1 hypothetical protein [Candidatus Thiothrix sp. Deng01]